MKIVIVGGTGTVGQAIQKELAPRHEVIVVGSQSGDYQVDIENPQSIDHLFQHTGSFDALICALGKTPFAPLTEMEEHHFQMGLNNKLMGQVRLVIQGQPHIRDHGSITLTSGILNVDPTPQSSSAAMVGGAIDGFVQAAAWEMPRGIRLNAVSPTVLQESMHKYGAFFRGYQPVAAADVAMAYSKSVEGIKTGQIIRAGY